MSDAIGMILQSILEQSRESQPTNLKSCCNPVGYPENYYDAVDYGDYGTNLKFLYKQTDQQFRSAILTPL